MTDREIADLTITTLRRNGHVGQARAITRRDLRWLLGIYGVNIDDRAFRRLYNSPLCAVCTGDEGLWIPASWPEVEEYLRYYGSKVRPELLRLRTEVMMEAYRWLRDRDVGPLFERGSAMEVRA